MTTTRKAEIIEDLTARFKEANCVILADYKGLNVPALESLRQAAALKDVRVQVVKNKLATIALKNADLEGIEIKDTNIFIWGEDAVATSKVAATFAKDQDVFTIKSAYIDSEASDAAKVEAFSKLPGREELLGMLAATWMAPVTNFTIGLDALKRKKEEEAA